MKDPTKEGEYTTIFKDGSIILKNEWLMFPNGNGKWYWNEDIRGGVIHWFEPEEEYELHKWYKISDWELRELLISSYILDSLYKNGVNNWQGYDYSFNIEYIEKLVDKEMLNKYHKGYEWKSE